MDNVIEEFDGWMNDAAKIKGPYRCAFIYEDNLTLVFKSMVIKMKPDESGGMLAVDVFKQKLKEWVSGRTVYIRQMPVATVSEDQTLVIRCRLAVVNDAGDILNPPEFNHEEGSKIEETTIGE